LAAWDGLASCARCGARPLPSCRSWHIGTTPIAPLGDRRGTILTLVTLIGVVTRPRSAAGSLLASRPMRWLGERSYSIHLWNVLARIAILNVLGRTIVGDIAWVAMFVVLAEASFRYVERPLAPGSRGDPVCRPLRSSVGGCRACCYPCGSADAWQAELGAGLGAGPGAGPGAVRKEDGSVRETTQGEGGRSANPAIPGTTAAGSA
jgi:hypothetical protein